MTEDPPTAAVSVRPDVPAPQRPSRWVVGAALVLALIAVVALAVAWRAEQRVRSSERDLVKRQQDSAQLVTEAGLIARQAQEGARDAAAKVALLEARLNEVSVQRSQMEELIQSVARSRDETLVVDIESSLRVAVQQAALTGSAEPLVAALRQSEERLARANQPRLEPVRRAIARDLDRARAAGVADVSSLSIKLDEAVRLVDELPLLAAAEPRQSLGRGAAPAAPAPAPPADAASAPDGVGSWFSRELGQIGERLFDTVWSEIRALVRITRIEHPEAMLVAPDQAFFLRENIKLRLLNARLSMLSRQTETARSDLVQASVWLNKYFDPGSRKTQTAAQLLQQVQGQLNTSELPRFDETMTALTTAAAGR